MWKTNRGEAESIILLIIVLWVALILGGWGVMEWGKKSYFRACWNRIFCFLFRLKSQSVKGASRQSSFYGSGFDQVNEE